MPSLLRIVLVALALVLPSGLALGDDRLLGTWIGSGATNRGERVTLERDALVMDGERIPLRFDGRGGMLVGPAGGEMRLAFELRGDELVVDDGESKSTWRRESAGPAAAGGAPVGGVDAGAPQNPLNPLGRENPANPLAKQAPPPDVFARRFAGDGLKLVLRGTRALGYEGELEFQGSSFPVRARAEGEKLTGTFNAGGEAFPFAATLSGDRLTLESGGATYRLDGDPLPKSTPTNPLLAGGAQGGARGKPSWTSQAAGLGADLPEGWVAVQEGADGALINPGFKDGQTLDVVLSLHALPLEPAQRTMEAGRLLETELPGTRESLAQNGIQTGEPGRIERFKTKAGESAASVTLDARTANGQAGKVWLALRVDGDKCLVLSSIYLGGKERDYLERAQRVFDSLQVLRAGAPEALETPRPSIESERATETPAVGAPGAQSAAPEKSAESIVMVPHELRDSGSGNMVSHKLLAPKGWKVEGGAWWANPMFFNVLPSRDIRVIAPDGREVHLTPTILAKDIVPAPQFGVARPAEMSADNGVPIIYMPRSLDEWKRWVETRGIPQSYRGASNIKVNNASIVPELTELLRRQLEPLRQLVESQRAFNEAQGIRTSFEANVMAFECSYRHEGRDWEEVAIFGISSQIMESALLGTQIVWTVDPTLSYRAPAGELEKSMPLLIAIANSARETPEWIKMRADLQAKLLGIAAEGARKSAEEAAKRSRIIASYNQEISDIISSGYREREAIQDRTHQKVINAIRGTEDYTLPGSDTAVSLPNTYDKVYTNGSGEYLLTNDHLFNPNTDPVFNSSQWQTMEVRR